MHANGNPCKGTYLSQISDYLSSDRSASRGWSVFGLQVHQLLKNVSCTSIGQGTRYIRKWTSDEDTHTTH